MVERAFGTHHDLIYLLVAGPLFFAVACAKAWLKENAARTRLEAMLSPWLSLELEPGKPYVEVLQHCLVWDRQPAPGRPTVIEHENIGTAWPRISRRSGTPTLHCACASVTPRPPIASARSRALA